MIIIIVTPASCAISLYRIYRITPAKHPTAPTIPHHPLPLPLPHPHPLPRKRHQPRIQHHRQQQMTPRNRRQRQNRHKIINMPIIRDPLIGRQSQKDHPRDTNQRKEHAEFEALRDFGDFDEEIRGFDFFGRGAPGHVVAEHVGEEGGGDVEGEAAEEDAEEEGPFEVHYYCEGGCIG